MNLERGVRCRESLLANHGSINWPSFEDSTARITFRPFPAGSLRVTIIKCALGIDLIRRHRGLVLRLVVWSLMSTDCYGSWLGLVFNAYP